jgi:hypothetical protein
MAKKTKEKKRERVEQRFLPQSGASPLIVRILGGLGAAALGAGVIGQYFRPEPVPYAVWVLAGGALLVGAALWIGSSGDPAVRVGDAGIAIEKGGLKRLPWWGVESIAWRADEQVLEVAGKDESGGEVRVRVGTGTQSQAVAWIVKEARERIPNVVELAEEALDAIPKAYKGVAATIRLEPVQVVGRRCADTSKVIAYEPDARICPRCERVYHKAHVPETCGCGGSLAALRRKPAEAVHESAAPEGTID